METYPYIYDYDLLGLEEGSLEITAASSAAEETTAQ